MRVAVHGTSGSGKTRVARAIAEAVGARLVELDAHRHQPGWTVLPDDSFRVLVAEAAAAETWVIDGNYEVVRALVDGRATLLSSRWLLARRHHGGAAARRQATLSSWILTLTLDGI